jgi:hypothetical protein
VIEILSIEAKLDRIKHSQPPTSKYLELAGPIINAKATIKLETPTIKAVVSTPKADSERKNKMM